MNRRRFLKAGAACGASFSVFACKSSRKSNSRFISDSLELSNSVFPQGVASGEPRADSVVLWTRVASEALGSVGATADIETVIEVSEQVNFDHLVIRAKAHASSKSDHTLRFLAKNLEPDKHYYYRFIVERKWVSRTGRTKTAPKKDSVRSIKFVWASCQDYEAGYYQAWRHLSSSQSTNESQGIDFILHVGDFIYETIGANFKDSDNEIYLSESGHLFDSNTKIARKITPLPSGGVPGRYGGKAATNLEDYRHIYRSYLSDADLQNVRALYPFVCIWDDHEFSDNGWHSGDFSGPKPVLRNAASQAWTEYIPVVYQTEMIQNELLVDHSLFDSSNAALGEENSVVELPIYRKLSFGKVLDLVISDNRLFRSQQLIPEHWEKEFFQQKLVRTPKLLNKLEGDGVKGFIEIEGQRAPLASDVTYPASILGAEQKAWWKQQMSESTKVWKVWANSVPFTSVKIDRDHLDSGCASIAVQSDDAWAGYPREKRELLNFIQRKKISNIVSISGDFHANIAAKVNESQTKSVINEFVIGALSSASLFRVLRLITPVDSDRYNYLFGEQREGQDKHLDKVLLETSNGTVTVTSMKKESNM